MTTTLDDIRAGLREARYVTTPRVETALFLAVTLGKPLLAEGPLFRRKRGPACVAEAGRVRVFTAACWTRHHSQSVRGRRAGTRDRRSEIPPPTA